MTVTQKVFAILLVILGFGLSACEASTIEPIPTSTPQPRNITVSGIGKVYLTPDIATISIGVHNEDESVTRAVNGINTQARDVTEILLEMGVEEEDIKIMNFNILPEERFDEIGNQASTVYGVDSTVFVTVRELDNLGAIMGSVVEAGANSIFGIQFDVADKTLALTKARKLAVENAQTKAEELAKAAGVTLGEIQSINELGGVPVPVFEGQEGGGFESPGDQLPVNLGQLRLTVEVSVSYNIQ
ncbi:MAG: SIMPL domain-containing protein [Anaerolineales bacterium]